MQTSLFCSSRKFIFQEMVFQCLKTIHVSLGMVGRGEGGGWKTELKTAIATVL